MSLAQIKRQVEYYFNDFNIMRDSFIKNEIKLSKEAGNNGYISLDIMLKFNKLAQLTTDKEKILNSLENSKLIQINEEKTGIRRNPERKLPVDDEIYRAGLKARTCMVEGFPRDSSKTDEGEHPKCTLDIIYNYFEETLKDLELDIETIAMRRVKNAKEEKLRNRFTGSIFITFVTQKDAQKYLADERNTLTMEGMPEDNKTFELKKMTKAMFWSLQNAESKAKKSGENVEAAIEAAKNHLNEKNKELNIKFEEGILLKFSGVTDATVRREDIKEFIVGKDGAIDYVSFEAGQDHGFILLNMEHGKKADEILSTLDENRSANIKGIDIKFESGSEEKFDDVKSEFVTFKKKMELRRTQGFSGKKGKFGKGKGRGFKGKEVNRNAEDEKKNSRKRFADSDDESPAVKVDKKE